eukprot:CAMPEP_0174376264 /NCGR_PEP_ID=MMETSP0811_2-20130205/117582_1 /TAXON_ID=73025 ORGANISM="Eutreptiella gymnastica-like, Strain CCMP1594" /NCGR_SAMPLE_ID=MMETSP0811_2 /ASSEMBLY_ACC=CAM_ASM_000667 /LENGTH=99 /DNA_ID=CAMNT_0015527277 /DNA_START=45 /DNA_END=341 /DNA_ORIENTATION=+
MAHDSGELAADAHLSAVEQQVSRLTEQLKQLLGQAMTAPAEDTVPGRAMELRDKRSGTDCPDGADTFAQSRVQRSCHRTGGGVELACCCLCAPCKACVW